MCLAIERDRRYVALRKESVDRNRYATFQAIRTQWSLSARRAWIEISWVTLGMEK